MRGRKSQRGLTLVEVVVTVAILSLLIVTTLSILNFGQKAFQSTDSIGRQQSDAALIARTISVQTRQATVISIPDARHLNLTYSDGSTSSFVWDGVGVLTYTKGTETRTLSDQVLSNSFELLAGGAGVELYIKLGTVQEFYETRTTAYKRV